MDGLNTCSWTFSEPGQLTTGETSALENPTSDNLVLSWLDQKFSACDNDADSISPIADDTHVQSYVNERYQASTENNYLYSQEDTESGKLKAFDEETSPTDNYPQFILRESLRAQRRRAQNRLSQRAYRQRRDEERQKLIDDLKAWKDKCKELDEMYKNLHLAFKKQKKTLKQMEEDNEALRSNLLPMAWQRGSL